MNRTLGTVLHHVRKLANRELSDGDLVRRFVSKQDEIAFAELLRRHGPLVLAVCRRVLGHEQDAEDAFQATFFVLARKAGSIRKGDALASWLHGVAYRVAMKEKTNAARRKVIEREAPQPQAADPAYDAAWYDLRRLLDEELHRLPEKYRAAFVLCCLEGQSRPAAARELGCKEGTLSSRLAHARKVLQNRLSKRGVTLSAALIAAAVVESTATAMVPPLLAKASVKAALVFASSPAAAMGLASANAVKLAAAILQSMALAPVKIATAVLAVACLLTAGAGLAHQAATSKQAPPTPASPKLTQGPNAPPAPAIHDKRVLTDRFGDPLPEGAVTRLGSARFRQGVARIHALLPTPDGKCLVSTGYYGDRMVCVWEVPSGRLLRSFPGNYRPANIALSPDGKTLATIKDEGHEIDNDLLDVAIELWDLPTGRRIHRLKGEQRSVRAMAFSSDGRTLATAGADRTLRLWDLLTAKETACLSVQGYVDVLQFTPGGKNLMAAGALGRTIDLWEVSSGKQLYHIDRGVTLRSVALSPDGHRLAAGGDDGDAVLWDADSGKPVGRLKTGKTIVSAVAFSPDSKTLAIGGLNQGTFHSFMILWDLSSGKELRRWQGLPALVGALAFLPDGKTLAGGCPGGIIRLWDVATAKELSPRVEAQGVFSSVALAPDGNTLASLAFNDTIGIWNLSTGQQCGKLQDTRPLRRIVFSPNGKFLATGSLDNVVTIWDVGTRKLLRRLRSGDEKSAGARRADATPAISDCLDGVAFSPDGKTVAAGSYDGTVRLFDPLTGQEQRRFTWAGQQIEDVALSPDGRTLAAVTRSIGGTSKVCFWDRSTGKELPRQTVEMSLPVDQAETEHTTFNITPRLVFSPDGKSAAINSVLKDLPLWEVATGRQRLRFKGHRDSITCVALSPDGRTLASASWDYTVRLWDVASSQELRRLVGHRGSVYELAFSADGKTLVTCGWDANVLVWDVAAITRRVRAQGERLSANDVKSLWADFALTDAAKAYSAMQKLVSAPAQATAHLKENLRPAKAPDARRLADLLDSLDSPKFEIRERATRELESLSDIELELERAGARPDSSLEFRRRVQSLLVKAAVPSGVHVQRLRAVEVLENIGTPEARQVLIGLAKGAADARLTREAKLSLERLARRNPSSP